MDDEARPPRAVAPLPGAIPVGCFTLAEAHSSDNSWLVQALKLGAACQPSHLLESHLRRPHLYPAAIAATLDSTLAAHEQAAASQDSRPLPSQEWLGTPAQARDSAPQGATARRPVRPGCPSAGAARDLPWSAAAALGAAHCPAPAGGWLPAAWRAPGSPVRHCGPPCSAPCRHRSLLITGAGSISSTRAHSSHRQDQ